MTRFGLLVPHFGLEADQDLLVEGARLAESLGFDSLWVRDHLVFHPHGMEGTDRTFIEPLITLTYLAGRTEKIGLGAATIIPFRHPINMAYSIASMSWITRRKFDLGIGAGTFDHEFEVLGQGAEDRVQMMKEQVLIARRLWSGETVEWDSERYKFTDVDLKPMKYYRFARGKVEIGADRGGEGERGEVGHGFGCSRLFAGRTFTMRSGSRPCRQNTEHIGP